ncbi:MAG TPA: hemerythrin domain-containing protein [Armatimonadota bacterium]|nr:hemerythrin domain-containing protein [Armatimonadota bacterium]
MSTITITAPTGKLASENRTRAGKSDTVAQILQYMERTYHNSLKDELPRLAFLMAKVARADGESYPEIQAASRSFTELSREILSYLWREEQVLFPWLRVSLQPVMGAAESTMLPVVLRSMQIAHTAIRRMLARMAAITSGYSAPIGASSTYEVLLYELSSLDSLACDYLSAEEIAVLPLLGAR